MKFGFGVFFVFCIWVGIGCDSKTQTGNAALDEVIEKNEEYFEEMHDRLDAGEGLEVDTEHIGEVADLLDEAAKSIDPEEARIVREQTNALRELQVLLKPYEDSLNKFLELGASDPSTFHSLEDFDERIAIVNALINHNEAMDEKMPGLYRKIGGDPTVVAETIRIVSDIRQADRELFPHVIGYLGVLKTNFGKFSVLKSGEVLFDEDISDDQLDALNLHANEMNRLSFEQGEMQRALLLLHD